MSIPNVRRTRFQPDAPTQDDRFNSHSRVAEALRATVTGEGSGLLELVGTFGSGKSTIIEVLRKKLFRERAVHKLVVYDSWAHQAESLRRSLLSTVVRNVDPDEEAKCLDKVRRSVGPPRTETETTTNTRPGPIGILTALVAVGLPLLVVFLTPAAQNHKIFWDGGLVVRSVEHHVHTALIVTGVFVLIAVLSFGIAFLAGWPRTKPKATEVSEDDALPSLGALFVQHVEATRTETTTRGELDTHTFEKHLRTTVRFLTEQGCTLTLVLDDLDRFPETDLEKAWSVLRSLHRLATGPEAIKGFWCIAPSLAKPVGTWDEKGKPRPAGVAGEDWQRKLFLARFETPPTLPGPAAEHLERLLQNAFPDHANQYHPKHDADELPAVARMLLGDRLVLRPREALRLVNDLIALYRQHGDDPVPLKVQAAFLVLDQSGDPLEVKDGERVRLQRRLGVRSWKSLAASLRYGLPPEEALERYLATRVQGAMWEGKRAVVEQDIESFPRATLRLLHRQALSFSSSQVPVVLDNAAWVLDAAPDEPPVIQRAWGHLLAEAVDVPSWENLSGEGANGQGLGIIIARVAASPDPTPARTEEAEGVRDTAPQDQALDLLFRAINQPILKLQGRGRTLSSQKADVSGPLPDSVVTPSKEDLEAWAAVLDPAMRTAIERLDGPSLLESYRVPGEPEVYISAIRIAADRLLHPDMPLAILRPEKDSEAIVRYLMNQAEAHGEMFDLVEVIPVLLKVEETWDWSPLLAAIKSRIEEGVGPKSLMGPSITPGNSYGGFLALLILAHHPRSSAQDEAAAILKEFSAEGVLHMATNHGSQTPSDEFPFRQILLDAIALAYVVHGTKWSPAEPEHEGDLVIIQASEDGDGWTDLKKPLQTTRAQLERLAAHVHATDALAARLSHSPPEASGDTASGEQESNEPTPDEPTPDDET